MGVSVTQLVVEDDRGRVIKATKPIIAREFPKKPAKPRVGGDESISLPGNSSDEPVTPVGSALPVVGKRGKGRPKGSKNKIAVPGPAKVPREKRESKPEMGLAHKPENRPSSVKEPRSNKGGGMPEDYGIILADVDDPNIEPGNRPKKDCGCGGACCDEQPAKKEAAVDVRSHDHYIVQSWRRF